MTCMPFKDQVKMKFAAVLLALAASASAFAPVSQPKVRKFSFELLSEKRVVGVEWARFRRFEFRIIQVSLGLRKAMQGPRG